MSEFDPDIFERGAGPGSVRFHDLMGYRVREILLVASLYDSFILEEDGPIETGLLEGGPGPDPGLRRRVRRATSGRAALERIREDPPDLVLAASWVGDMDAGQLARKIREEGRSPPVVLLSGDPAELERLSRHGGLADFEEVFLWQGDQRILPSIVRCVEDRRNVARDTELLGVQSILVVEDNVRYASSFLPLVHAEVVRQTRNVLSEGLNRAHRALRLRACPKVLLCRTFDDAAAWFDRYHRTVMGVISDIDFPREGVMDERAGLRLARRVREAHPDVPVLLQSSDVTNRADATALGASFVQKDSPLLLDEVRRFLVERMGFGDFVFRTPDGVETARARDLRSLEAAVRTVPDASLVYHAERNHFSAWLKARTEFELADRLRPHRVAEYPGVPDLRRDIAESVSAFRTGRQRGLILDYEPDAFDPAGSFARIGTGSLGGKGRGLAFAARLLAAYRVSDRFPGVRVGVPATLVLATGVFDEFLEKGDLLDFAVRSGDDDEVRRRFLAAPLPERATESLRSFVERVRAPLAVRSSSLLQDSRRQPFPGIYATRFLGNDAADPEARLAALLDAVRLVWASTYSTRAKAYMRATSHRVEQERMAVLVQLLAGTARGDLFYPDLSGMSRSHDLRPTGAGRCEDGIASLTVGLGTFAAEERPGIRFCPRSPERRSGEPATRFAALRLGGDGAGPAIERQELPPADRAPEPNGPVPLAAILSHLLDLAGWSLGSPVEIEYAVNLAVPAGRSAEFHLLQLRPMVIEREPEEVGVGGYPREALACRSGRVLGNGLVADIRDVVTVDLSRFDRAYTREAAREIGRFNRELEAEGLPYLLVGLGRWGSSDPWLGIPVTWEDISGARVIVEASAGEVRVTPSEGSHFSPHLATMQIGYFTVDEAGGEDFVDWAWLAGLPAEKERMFTRRIRLPAPLVVKMDGRSNRGIIVKPEGQGEG